ncbi:hypothetical protein B0I08_10113 [Glaciihabitans tibetensis]|uniref:Uncharacterized protein n=1 Tax=Glaciihabitans tibetensis TaxID=1266600 RepID=A0A2T0VI39_9MICO|nr:hypothetical protein [Glaciihabitans tibetensis]PRY69891.1 hypothetical protein B0I08_10113 [Glaciihabitans tibetensis]
MASLIQQRMALDRARTRALFGVWGGAGLAVVWAVGSILREFDPVSFVLAAGWVFISAVSVRTLRRARRDTESFEDEHGKDAGKQGIIGRGPQP